MNTLYGVPVSPFTRKVQLAFAYRSIPYELKPTVPGSDEPGFAAASPLRKIPAIRTEHGHQFADSSVILAYFERLDTDKPLYPSDPGQFAQALFMEELADTKLSEASAALYFQLVLAPAIYGREPDTARVSELRSELVPKQLALLETLLPDTDWIVGGNYSVADIAVGSALINLWQAKFEIDAALYPRVSAFLQRFLDRSDVRAQLQQEEHAMKAMIAQRQH